MKASGKLLIGHNLVLLSIFSNLVRVHADHGHLDGALEIEIVVAQVVGRGLELDLG